MATIAPNFHESYSTPENEGIRARVDDVADSIFSFMINALHGPVHLDATRVFNHQHPSHA
jgi:hypothetical protein